MTESSEGAVGLPATAAHKVQGSLQPPTPSPPGCEFSGLGSPWLPESGGVRDHGPHFTVELNFNHYKWRAALSGDREVGELGKAATSRQGAPWGHGLGDRGPFLSYPGLTPPSLFSYSSRSVTRQAPRLSTPGPCALAKQRSRKLHVSAPGRDKAAEAATETETVMVTVTVTVADAGSALPASGLPSPRAGEKAPGRTLTTFSEIFLDAAGLGRVHSWSREILVGSKVYLLFPEPGRRAGLCQAVSHARVHRALPGGGRRGLYPGRDGGTGGGQVGGQGA